MSTWLVPVFYVAVIHGVSYGAAPTAWLQREDPVVLKARCVAAMGLAVASLLLADGWTWTLDAGEVGRVLLLLAPLIYLQWVTAETGHRWLPSPKGGDQPRSGSASTLAAGWTVARDLVIVEAPTRQSVGWED